MIGVKVHNNRKALPTSGHFYLPTSPLPLSVNRVCCSLRYVCVSEAETAVFVTCVQIADLIIFTT